VAYHISKNCQNIRLKLLRIITKCLSKDSRCASKNSNREPAGCKYEAMPLESSCSVEAVGISHQERKANITASTKDVGNIIRLSLSTNKQRPAQGVAVGKR
jgi:hypothetical protein